MNVQPTDLPGVLVVEPRVYGDERGWLVETYSRDRYRAAGIAGEFVQDNLSSSIQHTLRGLHYRVRASQGKLVQVTRGAIFDVAVDVRASSPTRGRWVGVELSAETHRQLWIPPGFAHGFLALSEVADVHYKLTHPYVAEDERGIAWNDPDLAIAWPLPDGRTPLVSPRDRSAPRLRDAELVPT